MNVLIVAANVKNFNETLFVYSPTPETEEEWNRGCVLASAQNFARELKEMPSNLLTPSLFVERVGERLGGGRGRGRGRGRGAGVYSR